MELFSEVYGCYYSVVAKILEEAGENSLTRQEISRIVTRYGFSESSLHMLPKLLSGEWDLLRETDGAYRSKLQHSHTRLPLTNLQKSWLKALLLDRRIGLFVHPEVVAELCAAMEEVEPLFLPSDFHSFDAAADHDEYDSPAYQEMFRLALYAMKEELLLEVEYRRNERVTHTKVVPRRMLYSSKDDKFRMLCTGTTDKPKNVIFNMGRIVSLSLSDEKNEGSGIWEESKQPARNQVVVAISNERNALERCMLQFAAYDKQTELEEETGRYICTISYDTQEETELLIRILSFGPVLEVLGPPSFLRQIKHRVAKQMDCLAQTP